MTTSDVGASAPPLPTRRLYRRRDDKVFVGVCAALGRYTDIDPVIYRIVLVVLAVFGGVGVGLYAVAWVLIPDETGHAPIDSVLHRRTPRGAGRRSTRQTVGLVLVAVVLLALLGGDPTRSGALLALLAVAGFLLLRDWRTPSYGAGRPLVPGQEGTVAFAQEGLAVPATGSTVVHGMDAEIVAPRRGRRPMRPLGPSILLGAAVFGCVTAAAGGTLVTSLTLALAVIVVGLLIGIIRREARWLALPAVLLAGVLAAAGLARGVPLGDGTGNRAWVPATAADVHDTYQLGVGDALLDLRGVTGFGPGRTIRATVGAGRLQVKLPAGLDVAVRARSAAGEVIVLGRETQGVRAEIETGGQASPLHLDVRVGYGQVSVTQ